MFLFWKQYVNKPVLICQAKKETLRFIGAVWDIVTIALEEPLAVETIAFKISSHLTLERFFHIILWHNEVIKGWR